MVAFRSTALPAGGCRSRPPPRRECEGGAKGATSSTLTRSCTCLLPALTTGDHLAPPRRPRHPVPRPRRRPLRPPRIRWVAGLPRDTTLPTYSHLTRIGPRGRQGVRDRARLCSAQQVGQKRPGERARTQGVHRVGQPARCKWGGRASRPLVGGGAEPSHVAFQRDANSSAIWYGHGLTRSADHPAGTSAHRRRQSQSYAPDVPPYTRNLPSLAVASHEQRSRAAARI